MPEQFEEKHHSLVAFCELFGLQAHRPDMMGCYPQVDIYFEDKYVGYLAEDKQSKLFMLFLRTDNEKNLFTKRDMTPEEVIENLPHDLVANLAIDTEAKNLKWDWDHYRVYL